MKGLQYFRREIRQYKDSYNRSEIYTEKKIIKNNLTGQTIPLSSLVKTQKQQKKAEFQNRLNSFLEYTEYKNLRLVFLTFTLLPKYHNPKSSKDVKVGYEHIQNFMRDFQKTSIFQKMKNKKVNEEYIKPVYSYMNEFHKDFTLHRHISYFIKKEDLTNFLKAIHQAKKNYNEKYSAIGRLDIVLDARWDTKNVNQNLSLECDCEYKTAKKVINYVYGDYKKGTFTQVRFLKRLKNKDNNKDVSSKAVAKYVAKYALKTLNSSKNPAKMNNFELIATSLKYTLNLRLYQFSRVLFPITLYRKMKDSDNKKAYSKYSLFNLTILQEHGLLHLSLNVEKRCSSDILQKSTRAIKLQEKINYYSASIKIKEREYNQVLRLQLQEIKESLLDVLSDSNYTYEYYNTYTERFKQLVNKRLLKFKNKLSYYQKKLDDYLKPRMTQNLISLECIIQNSTQLKNKKANFDLYSYISGEFSIEDKPQNELKIEPSPKSRFRLAYINTRTYDYQYKCFYTDTSHIHIKNAFYYSSAVNLPKLDFITLNNIPF